jgi:Skp family chaperone for outer membrane proteins
VQFIERDKRTEQLALASSTAIAAALQAAKEAVGAQNTSNSIAIAKSESSTLESLRQLRELFLSETKAINEKVDDLKSRLDRGEGKGTGAVERQQNERANIGQGLAIVSVLISALVAGVAILVAVLFHR